MEKILDTCPKCRTLQYSIMDKKYLSLFTECWSCDRDRWAKSELSLEEFERRERLALDN